METTRIPALEAAKRLGVSVETVRTLAEQGAVAAQHSDSDYWFLPEDVEAYASRQAFNDAPGDGDVSHLVRTPDEATLTPPPSPYETGASEGEDMVRVPLQGSAGNLFRPGDVVRVTRAGGRWFVEGGLIHNVQEDPLLVTIFADAPPENDRTVITYQIAPADWALCRRLGDDADDLAGTGGRW
jgi:hypothetical protein